MSILENVNKTASQISGSASAVDDVMDMDLGALFGQPNKMSLLALKGRATGYARPNRFYVAFAAPKTISQYYPVEKMEMVTSMVREAQLPAIKLGTFDHRSIGPMRQLPNDVIFQPVNISFFVDDKFTVRQFFQDWISTITTNNRQSFNYLEEYSTNIQITQLNADGKPEYTVELIDAYPVTLGDMQLSAESENNIMFQNVTFSYHQWREINPDTLDDFTVGGIMNNLSGGLSGVAQNSLGRASNMARNASSLSERFRR